MKKVIVVLMAVVMMVAVTVVSYSAEYQYPTYDEGYEMLVEWAETYGYENCVKKKFDGEFFNYCGCLNAPEFEKETKMPCTIENYVNWSIEYFNMKSLVVKQVGEIEGHDVYYATGIAYESLAYGYEKVNVLFMMCA